MPENKFDSGHAIIPVLHPESGEVHSIAVSNDVPLSELHDALAGYHSQPTESGALENQQTFKDNNRALWDTVHAGEDRAEAGNFINRDGSFTPIQKADNENGQAKMNLDRPASSTAIVHTHPNSAGAGPSQQDIETAKLQKMTVFVVSRDGLFAVDPGGEVSHVYLSSGDATKGPDKPKPKWQPKYKIDPKTGRQIRIN